MEILRPFLRPKKASSMIATWATASTKAKALAIIIALGASCVTVLLNIAQTESSFKAEHHTLFWVAIVGQPLIIGWGSLWTPIKVSSLRNTQLESQRATTMLGKSSQVIRAYQLHQQLLEHAHTSLKTIASKAQISIDDLCVKIYFVGNDNKGEVLQPVIRTTSHSLTAGSTQGIRWTKGKGVIGRAWENEGKLQVYNIENLIPKFPYNAEVWNKTSSQVKMGIGFNEISRLTHVAGVVAMAVKGGPEGNEWLAVIAVQTERTATSNGSSITRIKNEDMQTLVNLVKTALSRESRSTSDLLIAIAKGPSLVKTFIS